MDLFRLKIAVIFMSWPLFFAPNVLAQCYLWYGDKWSGSSVAYHINSGLGTSFATQQDYENAIDSAVSQWNRAGVNFQFNKGSDVSYDPNTEPDGVYQLGNSTVEPCRIFKVSPDGTVTLPVKTF